jgi:hypothetical protein
LPVVPVYCRATPAERIPYDDHRIMPSGRVNVLVNGLHMLGDRHNPAVTSFIGGQARRCVHVWSAKTPVTATTRPLLRFLHVEGVISAPFVGAVPATASWRLSVCCTQMEKPPDHKLGIIPTAPAP